MMLGDMGADIIKVTAGTGDDTRTWGPPFAEKIGVLPRHQSHKRSMTLNWR